MVEQYENADEEAWETTEKASTSMFPERFVSLTHVSSTIMERKWKKAKQWFRAEQDRCPLVQMVKYDLVMDIQGLDKAGMEGATYLSRQYILSKSGHAVIETNLYRIGKATSNQCWECTSRTRRDIDHTLFNCSS